ncbi:helix-turn-helix domain-containing protein [Sinorhizobium fredii]|uniref:helix-turn-helix domain-containing protein n=1 Tax=Rhizobium fredii TaxID=380 RepID=UPI0035112C99
MSERRRKDRLSDLGWRIASGPVSTAIYLAAAMSVAALSSAETGIPAYVLVAMAVVLVLFVDPSQKIRKFRQQSAGDLAVPAGQPTRDRKWVPEQSRLHGMRSGAHRGGSFLSSNLPARKKPDPIDSNVGRKIRRQRLLLPMSQTKLAQALGITYQQVQKYENGRTKVSASRLQAIANALKYRSPLSSSTCLPETSSEARLDTGRSMGAFVASPMGIALNRAFARITELPSKKEIRFYLRRVSRARQTPNASDEMTHRIIQRSALLIGVFPRL